MTFASAYFANSNVGTFLAAAVTAICANAWGRWMDRPNTVCLVPALTLLVSGNIGFRGIISFAEGDISAQRRVLANDSCRALDCCWSLRWQHSGTTRFVTVNKSPK